MGRGSFGVHICPADGARRVSFVPIPDAAAVEPVAAHQLQNLLLTQLHHADGAGLVIDSAEGVSDLGVASASGGSHDCGQDIAGVDEELYELFLGLEGVLVDFVLYFLDGVVLEEGLLLVLLLLLEQFLLGRLPQAVELDGNHHEEQQEQNCRASRVRHSVHVSLHLELQLLYRRLIAPLLRFARPTLPRTAFPVDFCGQGSAVGAAG